MSANNGKERPSQARRERLKTQPPCVSNFFPIETYYDKAQIAYDAFQEAFRDPKKLDEAYSLGKRYASFCVDAIPTHNYYGLPKNKNNREKHEKQVKTVLDLLEEVVDRMDAEEIQKQKEQEELAKREHILLSQRYEALQQQDSNRSKPGESVATSAMSKLEQLRVNVHAKQEGTGRVNSSASSDQPRVRRDPSGEKPTRTSRYYLPPDDEDDEDELVGSLPPPLPPPMENGALPPPSYNQVVSTRRNGRYRPETMMSQSIGPHAGEKPAKRRERIPMAQIKEKYLKDYQTYVQAGSITVCPLNTYQGRTWNSTNGCTVISALVAACHLNPRPTPITDGQIDAIIDQECGPILRKIRGKLGLGDHALIIPSDVHDQLVDDNILHQKYFVGVAGGNVMDPEHMGEFLKLLVFGEDGKSTYSKAAATFFFREHVISIVKMPIGNGKVEFDLIDSLPGASNGGRSVGTRTRCSDSNSLQVLLRWYTSRKFSDSDCSYIDRNEWSDAEADTDPRVFQGFVWAVQ